MDFKQVAHREFLHDARLDHPRCARGAAHHLRDYDLTRQGPIKRLGVTLAIGDSRRCSSCSSRRNLVMEWLIESGIMKKFTMRHLLKSITWTS